MTKYTLAVWIASWSPPENGDLVHVASKAAALERIASDQRHAERFGAGYEPPGAWLWHGQLDEIQYPDYVLEHGPRGGAYWRNA